MTIARILRYGRASTTSFLRGDLAVTMTTNLFLAGLALVTGPLAARLLGPEGRGELAAIQTWPMFLATIGTLGLPEAIVYFTAKSPARARKLTTTAIITGLVLAVPIVLVSYWLMPIFLAAQSRDIVSAARWYLLLIPITIVLRTLVESLRGRSDFVIWNFLRVMPSVNWLITLLAAILLNVSTPQWIAGIYLVLLSILTIPWFVIFKRRSPDGDFQPDTWQVWPMLKYGLPSAASAVPQTLNLRLDQMLMATFLSPGLLGLYVVAVAWSNAIAPLLRAVGMVIFPRIAGQDLILDRTELLARAFRLAGLLSTGLTILLLFLTPFAIPWLFGEEFQPAIPAALILLIAGGVFSQKFVLQNGVRGLGAPQAVLWSECAGLLVTIVALLLLLGPFDIIGAAVASLLGYAAALIVLIYQTRCLTGCTISCLLWPRREDIRFVRSRWLTITRDN